MGLNWADAGTLLRGTPGLSASIADTVTPLTLETSCCRTAHLTYIDGRLLTSTPLPYVPFQGFDPAWNIFLRLHINSNQ